MLERAHAGLREAQLPGRSTEGSTDGGAVSAERGYLREAGNLLFHLSVLVVLVGFAVGGLWGFKGGVIVVTKDGFANTLSQYDDFRAGSLFDPAELEPFDFTVNDFDVTFIREGREAGMAHEFAADLTYRTSPGAAERDKKISVNHPLSIDGTDVFLISHGYAPHITVRNADGTIAFSGPVVFLPEDSTFRSFGVVKVPDASPEERQQPARARGRVLPDVRLHQGERPVLGLPRRQEPRDLDARLVAATSVWTRARRSRSTRCRRRASSRSGRPTASRCGSTSRWAARTAARRARARVTFDGVSRYVKLQVSHTPGQLIALGGVVLGADRAARLAVHPPAADVGAGTSGGRAYARRGRRARPQRGWRPDRRDRELHRLAPAGAHRQTPQESRRDPRRSSSCSATRPWRPARSSTSSPCSRTSPSGRSPARSRSRSDGGRQRAARAAGRERTVAAAAMRR